MADDRQTLALNEDNFRSIVKTSLREIIGDMRNPELCKPCREISLAITKLQEAVMWIDESQAVE